MPALAPALATRQRKARQSRSTHEPGATNPEWNESRHLGAAAADVGETPQFVPMGKPDEPELGPSRLLHSLVAAAAVGDVAAFADRPTR